MLRITTELVPHGKEADKSTLSLIEISNRGEVGNGVYKYWYSCVTDKEGIGNFVLHNRSDGHLKLLQLVLSDIVNT